MNKHLASLALPALLFALLPVTVGAARIKPPAAAAEWYVKMRLDVRDPATSQTWFDATSGVFGKLAGASATYDAYDIPVYSSASSSKAAVVFVQDASWGAYAGQYVSDYRNSNVTEDQWQFSVVSTAPQAALTLSWDGLFQLSRTTGSRLEYDTYNESRVVKTEIMANLQLVDLQTLEVVPALLNGELNQYSFNFAPGETTRSFRWVLGPINTKHLDPTPGMRAAVERAARQPVALPRGLKPGKLGVPPGQIEVGE